MEERDLIVSFADGVVSVDQPTLTIDFGVTALIKWIPEPGADWVLKMVVFTRPIGAGTPIAFPQPGPGGTIVTTDVNENTSGAPDTFKYLVFVEQDGRLYPSPDPQIVNDPEGGMGGEDDEDDDQGGD